MMRPNNAPPTIAVLTAIALTLLIITSALAAGITIDGSFGDWSGKAAYIDSGGADDETSPARADITEFRIDADASGLYLLKAWDNTAFTGGTATTSGVTVRTVSNSYYRVYTTADGNPGSVALSTLSLQSCTDATCSSQTQVCAGSACTGAVAGSGATWDDPFSTRASPACTGTNCGTKDTAVELFLPWALIGGAPTGSQTVFIQFGSYPSGPAQAPKDTPGPNGITCRINNGAFECYPSTPTAITMLAFSASSDGDKKLGVLLVVGAALLAACGMITWRLRSRMDTI